MTEEMQNFLTNFVIYLVDERRLKKNYIAEKTDTNRMTVSNLYNKHRGSEGTFKAFKKAFPKEVEEFEELQGIEKKPTEKDRLIKMLEKRNEELLMDKKELRELKDYFKNEYEKLKSEQNDNKDS